MRKLLLSRKKAIAKINRLMWEEHSENQFEDNQLARAYSAGIIDGLGMSLTVISDTPSKDARVFPLSISFYEEDAMPTKAHDKVEHLREKMFDLQNDPKLSLFYEKAN